MKASDAGQDPLRISGLIAKRHNEQEASTSILVVEDEDFVREVTCEVLLAAGYQVLRARTAAEAIRLFPRDGQPVQLLLTDIVLPGRSGRVLAQELKSISADLKTIFISGYPENEVAKQSLQSVGVFYLPKPFSVEMLLKAVCSALGEPPVSRPERRIAMQA